MLLQVPESMYVVSMEGIQSEINNLQNGIGSVGYLIPPKKNHT
jgi:hypothetical protein